MNSTPSREADLRRLGAMCFAVVAGLSGVVLLAWWLGRPRVGVFYMAASTLVLLLGLSVSGWLCQRPGNPPVATWLGRLIGLGTLVMTLLACTRFVSSYVWPGEAWLAQALGPSQGNPIVHMSQTAAFGFLLASLAGLSQCHPCLRRPGWRQVAAVLALAEMLLGLVLLLCYLLQARYFAHMAFLGAVGLLLMGLGLLLAAGPDLWPANLFLSLAPKETSGRQATWAMLSFALLLAVTVVATSRFYSTSQQANARRAAWRALAAVLDLKATQIAQWRNERIGDASNLRRTPYVARRALDVFNEPAPSRADQVFRSWLTRLLGDKKLERIVLLDEHFNARLVHPKAGDVRLSESALRAAAEAARTREIVAGDLERETDDSPVRFSCFVPLVARREGDKDVVPAMDAEALPTDQTKGVLVMQVNVEETFYPMLATWPAPSPTSEILLLRQEGDDVVLLNPVRSATNAALTVRLPVARRSLEGRAIAGGGKAGGEVKGFDYRFAPALGVWRRIPDSPWVLLAKVDVEEINAPILRQAWTTGGFVGLLVGAAMLGMALLARQRHLVSVRRELVLERQHREAERKFHTLFESSRDAIMLLERGRFYDCNQATLDLFGCASRDRFIARHPSEFSPPRQADGTDSRKAAEARIQAAYTQGVQFFEWLHRRVDGSLFPAEVLLNRIELDGRAVIQGVVRDITERKRAEAALLEISDREQARLGQDLHDGLCQHLVGTAFAANTLGETLAERNAPEAAEAQKIAALLDDAISQARNSARGLFPVQMEAEGLAVALRELAAGISRRPGLVCKMDYPAPVFIRDNSIATQLYRIALEAVNNAIRHGRPQRIVLRLLRKNEQIELAVLDDGTGIASPPGGNGGMGLSIMEYRARAIGGTFKIGQRPEGGTAVTCFVRETPAPIPAGNTSGA